MKKLVITGKMGSGKTTLAAQLLKNNFFFLRRPLFYINADMVATKIVKNTISISKKKLRYELFYGFQKKRYWNYIRDYIHPLVTHEFKKIFTWHHKGTLIIDIALPHLLPSSDYVYCALPTKSLYKNLFLLRKYRNIPYRQSIILLNIQNIS